jgi:uncharacterized coiled-coil DUF342 family protein
VAEDDMTPVPTKRMTVTRLGHKVDELHETVDELGNDLAEIKMVLKSLLEIQLGLGENEPSNPDDEARMYG